MGEYEGVLQTLIRNFKYDGQFALSETAVELMTKSFPPEYVSIDLFVPVPLHSKRLRERGFNQSELIAKGLARNIHIPSASKLLIRSKHTTPQATLKRAERLQNMKHAFALNQAIWGKVQETKTISSVLLIDDVSTTGTTLAACAEVLKKAGVKKIYGFVLAHGAT
jgi:ComF family protein